MSSKKTKYSIFKFPKTILLYNQREYVPQRITLNALMIDVKKFILKIPQSNKNSPTKLLVPGKAMLAIVKIRNRTEYNGIIWTSPP